MSKKWTATFTKSNIVANALLQQYDTVNYAYLAIYNNQIFGKKPFLYISPELK